MTHSFHLPTAAWVTGPSLEPGQLQATHRQRAFLGHGLSVLLVFEMTCSQRPAVKREPMPMCQYDCYILLHSGTLRVAFLAWGPDLANALHQIPSPDIKLLPRRARCASFCQLAGLKRCKSCDKFVCYGSEEGSTRT